MRQFVKPAVLAALLWLPSVAVADTFRVPGDSDTIQGAVDLAQPGDTVAVAKGVYAENVVLDGLTDVRILGKGKPTITATQPNGASAVAERRCSQAIAKFASDK